MTTPARGDVLGIPVNPQGQKAAEAWDYARDMAAGNQCKAYGAGGIMRMPTRLRIGWQDDNTLKIETDAGQQTKLLHFDRAAAAGPRTLQGHSTAEWVDVFGAGRAGVARGGGEPAVAPPPAYGTGALRVVTTNLRDGLPAQERRALQPERRGHGVLRPRARARRRAVAGREDHGGGPGVPGAAVPVERALHARAGRVEVASLACEVDPPLVPTKSDVR